MGVRRLCRPFPWALVTSDVRSHDVPTWLAPVKASTPLRVCIRDRWGVIRAYIVVDLLEFALVYRLVLAQLHNPACCSLFVGERSTY